VSAEMSVREAVQDMLDVMVRGIIADLLDAALRVRLHRSRVSLTRARTHGRAARRKRHLARARR